MKKSELRKLIKEGILFELGRPRKKFIITIMRTEDGNDYEVYVNGNRADSYDEKIIISVAKDYKLDKLI